MSLDIRIPTGLLFGIIGAILVVFGLVSDKAIYVKSLDINVNFWWGLVLLAFAALMLGLAWAASRAAKKKDAGGCGCHQGKRD